MRQNPWSAVRRPPHLRPTRRRALRRLRHLMPARRLPLRHPQHLMPADRVRLRRPQHLMPADRVRLRRPQHLMPADRVPSRRPQNLMPAEPLPSRRLQHLTPADPLPLRRLRHRQIPPRRRPLHPHLPRLHHEAAATQAEKRTSGGSAARAMTSTNRVLPRCLLALCPRAPRRRRHRTTTGRRFHRLRRAAPAVPPRDRPPSFGQDRMQSSFQAAVAHL